MGLGAFSHSSYDRKGSTETVTSVQVLPNPNPRNYRIVKSECIGKWLVVMVNYPDCTNYEGNKILLYYDTTLEKLLAQGSLDPHFSNNVAFISPEARFRPTAHGWNLACTLARANKKP